jgi:tetratricopeptide (TPR) repeat protein
MIKRKLTGLVTATVIAVAVCGCGGKSASQYNKEGMEFYNSQDYDQAEDYLAKAISMDEDNVTYLQNYAMILIQQGKTDEAIEKFEATVSDKKSSKAKKNNKYAYRGIGMAYIQTHEYDKAIESFDKALDIDVCEEWDTDITYYKANATLLNGDKDTALSLYSDIIDADSENYLAYESRAGIYRDLGNYINAIADYYSALDYCEGDFELYIGLAACLIENGETSAADDQLFNATLLDVETDEDKYYLGVVHYYQGNYESAKPEMEYALANGIEDAYFYLAEMCLMDEEYDEAMEYFDKYTQTTVVTSPTVCNDLAVCYINGGDYETAYEWVTTGLQFSTSSVLKQLKRNEIACLEGLGDLSTAFEKLTDYVEAYPDDEGAAKEYEFLKDRV